ncbi:unnamed protein product [Callosobruchus maculatus]|uniref:Uncharacterized protein n=1 Tax=Callosobruchus maculatus TaxID=64391 RepID=A0A653BD94_CALMS|nr:unnamed protein product [Callosobruchus maculatus]
MRKLLTEGIVREYWRSGDPTVLREEVPNPVFGPRSNCGNFCAKKLETDLILLIEQSIYYEIKKFLDTISAKADRLTNLTIKQQIKLKGTCLWWPS